MSNKVYEIVNESILGMLEKGTVPWQRPWVTNPPLNVRGTRYRGINVWLLSAQAMAKGYKAPIWLTFKQAKAMGGSVKKGESSTLVIFWKFLEKDRDGKVDKFAMLRYYRVFNVEQCEGLNAEKLPKLNQGHEFSPLEACEKIVAGMADLPQITHGGDRASYCPPLDVVRMPHPSDFSGTEEYYSTLFHELGHSTGHERRLGRLKGQELASFGSDRYSKEELVAEMTAAYLAAEAGIENRTIDNSAAYIQNWMRRIKDDVRLVVMAASQAEKAADFILGRKFGEAKDESEEPAEAEAVAVAA